VPAASGRKARGLSVLLIELSAEGARISGLDQRALAEGGRVTLRISGQEELGAQVRWAHDGCAGLMFDVPFHVAELAALVAACRPAPAPAPIAGAAALRMAG
jgi:hypothetical protein